MTKQEKQKGITLIALIITIVVLLILATVTISLTLGERGIFNTAKQAGKNYKEASDIELAELENIEKEMQNVISGINNESTNAKKEKTYLYKSGDKCEDITGGWKGATYTNIEGGVIEDRQTTLFASAIPGTTAYHSRWFTATPISLKDYNKVVFKGRFTTPSEYYNNDDLLFGKLIWAVTGVSPEERGIGGDVVNTFSIIAANIESTNGIIDSGNGIQHQIIAGGEYEYMEIPITEINDERYITIDCQSGSSFELIECWLE